jgi:predicted nucleic-acid-binding Zn-ribbon protein
MIVCPKCGSGHISRPKYEPAADKAYRGHAVTVAECLRYTCINCGYSETTPTLDAKQEAKADA